MSPHTVVTVTGNLTADPALRYTREGAPFTTFSVAFNRSYYDRDAARWQQSGTDFYDGLIDITVKQLFAHVE